MARQFVKLLWYISCLKELTLSLSLLNLLLTITKNLLVNIIMQVKIVS